MSGSYYYFNPETCPDSVQETRCIYLFTLKHRTMDIVQEANDRSECQDLCIKRGIDRNSCF